MNAPELLNKCEASGLHVFISGGGLKASGNQDAIEQFVPLLKTRKAEIEQYLAEQSLYQFRFDLISAEIESEHHESDLNRVNNMAWEFMQVDGMSFTVAINLAAEIVVKGRVAACEAAYVNVRDLFMRLSNSHLTGNQ